MKWKNINSCFLCFLFIFAIGGLQRAAIKSSYSRAEDVALQNEQIKNERTIDSLTMIRKFPSFGFRNVGADWAFIRFLQYFGDDEIRQQSSYGLSPEFFETVVALDPYYTDFYLYLSGSTTMYAGKPQRTIDIMRTGIDNIGTTRADDNYLIWRYKAVDELLFLGDGKAAQTSFRNAADWAKDSNHPDAEILYNRSLQTAKFLAENPNSKQAQISAWGSVLTNALDDNARRYAIDTIRRLGGEVIVDKSGNISLKYSKTTENEASEPSYGIL